jgi:hypothetical protein
MVKVVKMSRMIYIEYMSGMHLHYTGLLTDLDYL